MFTNFICAVCGRSLFSLIYRKSLESCATADLGYFQFLVAVNHAAAVLVPAFGDMHNSFCWCVLGMELLGQGGQLIL